MEKKVCICKWENKDKSDVDWDVVLIGTQEECEEAKAKAMVSKWPEGYTHIYPIISYKKYEEMLKEEK